jgi:hypothetical protein
MNSYDISITDHATPAIRRVMELGQTRQLNQVLGRAAVNLLRQHFFNLDKERPNQLGGQRTHFWAAAARSTTFTEEPDGVTVSIDKVGVQQRWRGGEIHAVKSTYLTIPARAEYHGKHAREFDNLVFVILKRGGPALVEAEANVLRKGKRKGQTVLKPKELTGGAVAYWLRRSVYQNADPSVLPTEPAMLDYLVGEADAWAQRHLARN